MKHILLGVLMLGLVAGTVSAAWDPDIGAYDKENVQAYSAKGVYTLPWFTPNVNGQTYLMPSSIGLRLEQSGIWGAVDGQGSPGLTQTFMGTKGTSLPYVQYWFPNDRILAVGQITASTPGFLSWAKVDYTIPQVYEIDGTTPVEVDKKIIASLMSVNQKIPEWDMEVRHDICYGTGTVSIAKLDLNGKWTLKDKSDFCSAAKEKEMAQYRNN